MASTNLATCQPATSINCSGSIPNIDAACASARRRDAEAIGRTRSHETAGQFT
jgi:hypothetical protein